MATGSRPRTDDARILIVEDNDDCRLLMELALGDAGYVVESATCAEDALRMMQERRYDLLLSDYSLPGYSGAWLLHQAFARDLIRSDAALMITGDPDAPAVRDVGQHVVAKPVNFDRFIPDISVILDGSSQASDSDVAA